MNLTPEDIRRRQELTNKLNYGTILPHEREELRRILEIEREEARKSDDWGAWLLIGMLLIALIAFSSKNR